VVVRVESVGVRGRWRKGERRVADGGLRAERRMAASRRSIWDVINQLWARSFLGTYFLGVGTSRQDFRLRHYLLKLTYSLIELMFLTFQILDFRVWA